MVFEFLPENPLIAPGIFKATVVINPMVMVSQVTSTANYFAYSDLRYVGAAIKGFSGKNSNTTLEEMPVAYDRYYMAHSNVALGDALSSDQTLRFMTGKSKGIVNKFSIGLRTMDLKAISAGLNIAKAEYKDAQNGDMKKDGLSFTYWESRNTSFEEGSEDAQREIVRRADYLVEMSQPSWNKWARSSVTSNPRSKIFFPFRSFHEKSLTIWHRANLDYHRSEKTLHDRGQRIQKKGAILSGYMINTMLRMLIMSILYREFPEPRDAIINTATSFFAMIPVLGRLMQTSAVRISNIIADESPGYRGEPIESLVIEVVNDALGVIPAFTDGLAYLANGDEVRAERSFKKGIADAWYSIGTMQGVPTYKLSKTYEGWFEEEQETKSKAKKRKR